MAAVLVLGGAALVVYLIYRKWASGGQDDIDGYQNKIEYNVEGVLKGRVNYELIEELKNKIAQYGWGASVEYIGITSGDDPVRAMKSRVDSKKIELGINCMRLLYQTSSYDNSTRVESELIEHSKAIHRGKNANEKGGGGGRIPSCPEKYYVYVAYKY